VSKFAFPCASDKSLILTMFLLQHQRTAPSSGMNNQEKEIMKRQADAD
jgi:hypothetical protein